MRLYLLPISTRRTLLYCQRLEAQTAGSSGTKSYSERVQEKAASTWASWEQKDKGWQKTVVSYGNRALRRIPYEEWGLKSVPPLSERRKTQETDGTDKVEVVFPKSLIPTEKVSGVIRTLATEREALHKRKLIWCLVGMPISAPVALIPVVPNIPFFYLVYRAWSHYRAIQGGRHLQFLLKGNLLSLTPSPIVDRVYATQEPPLESSPKPTTTPETDMSENITPFPPPAIEPPYPQGETMLLSQENAKRMTQELKLPALEVELERAIWQVETAIRKQNEASRKEEVREEKDREEKEGHKGGVAGTGVEIPRPEEDKETR
ncbi:mitochondrial K+-H+ exchange-related-domain-containing protein [Coniochaeta sp. 2T2.1]|nr:mitochondrial K+-H+ exchange-related-domain-containing protein [Coniochaeta sp. 2T2.1]